jgi:chorismate mutase
MQRKLEEERQKISDIDCAIIQLLGKRRLHEINIGKMKHLLEFPIHQPIVWENMSANRCLIALENELELELITQLFEIVHHYSKRAQQQHIKK